jgi:hypothetical protein
MSFTQFPYQCNKIYDFSTDASRVTVLTRSGFVAMLLGMATRVCWANKKQLAARITLISTEGNHGEISAMQRVRQTRILL